MTQFRQSKVTFVALLCCSIFLGRYASAQQGVGGGQGGQGGQGQGGQQGQTGNGQGGILVDADGLVRPMFQSETSGKIERKRREEMAAKSLPPDLNRPTKCRKVSLVQLEAALGKKLKSGEGIPADMAHLAGLQRIDYVFAYPNEHDLVIAGPAEGFAAAGPGRALGTASGQPALRLEDLVVAFRSTYGGGGPIRCSIDPNQQNLAQFSKFVASNRGGATLEAAQEQYQQMADILGPQDVSLSGVPADSKFAELLVEADIRMKHIAIGLDMPPVKGFRSHLAMVGSGANSLQRWWFAPYYDKFTQSADGLGFEFRGQRVQLLSEDELVSDSGRRSSAPFTKVSTQKYAKQFTERFPDLARAVPAFAELQGAFDLAVLAALIKKEDLTEKTGWRIELLLDNKRLPLSRQNVPKHVPSVSNFKLQTKGVMVMQITGGVLLNASEIVRHGEFEVDAKETLGGLQKEAAPPNADEGPRWWWD